MSRQSWISSSLFRKVEGTDGVGTPDPTPNIYTAPRGARFLAFLASLMLQADVADSKGEDRSPL